MHYIDEDMYPKNYDWLSKDKQQAILNYLADIKEQSNIWYMHYLQNQNTPNEEFYKKIWREYFDECDAIAYFLARTLDIYIEYDWCGHRGQYFFATYDDAVDENNFLFDLEHDSEGDVDEYRVGIDYDD